MSIRIVVIHRHLKGFEPVSHAIFKVDTAEFVGQPEEVIQNAIETLVDKQAQSFISRYQEFKEANFYSTVLLEEDIPLTSLKLRSTSQP